MPDMDKALRNTLRNLVTQCRKLLEEAIREILEGRYGIYTNGGVEETNRLTSLSTEEAAHRKDLIAHLKHIQASVYKSKLTAGLDAEVEQLKYEPSAVCTTHPRSRFHPPEPFVRLQDDGAARTDARS